MPESKKLIVYYSRSGSTKKLALILKEKLNADIEEIMDVKNRNGFAGYVQSLGDIMFKNKANIEGIKSKLSNYDPILIGTPVWGGSLSTPVRSFVEKYKKSIKKFALFATCATEIGEAFNQIEEILGKKTKQKLVLKDISLNNPQTQNKITDFTESLK